MQKLTSFISVSFIDTGASVNIMTKQCFDNIRNALNRRFAILDPLDLQLCGTEETIFNTLGTIPFDRYLFPDLPPVKLTFYIADRISIPADALIGRPTLTDHGIGLYPRLHGIIWRDRFIPKVLLPIESPHDSVSIYTIHSTPGSPHAHGTIPTPD